MDSFKFKDFNDKIVDFLYDLSKKDRKNILRYKKPEDFEQLIVDVANSIDIGEKLDIIYEKGSHGFPDIIIKDMQGKKFGIEVKLSISNSKAWKTNGNSILGSTKDIEVLETYIIFGKISKSFVGFKTKRYQDCIANIVVTHSPRYLIDMELEKGQTFFDISKISYESSLTRAARPRY